MPEILDKYENWLRSRGLKERSVMRYLKAVRRLLSEFSLEELDMEALEDFTARAKSHAHGIKSFLKFMSRYDPRFNELYEGYKLPRRHMKLPVVLTREEVDRIINAGRNIAERAFLATLYETGARLFEVLNLTTLDVAETDAGFDVTIRDSKSQPRTVIVVEYAHLLKLHLVSIKGGRLWPYGECWAQRVVRRAAKKAGVRKRVTPHTFRHSRATHMLAEGILTETEAMLWFGWHTRNMLDRYVHLTMRHVKSKVLAHYGKARKLEEPVICWRCHHVNPPRSEYCVRCGASLNPKEAFSQRREIDEIKRQLEELNEAIQKIAEMVLKPQRVFQP